ncbi:MULTISPECIES: GNAT family N-acetyltransferase [unclassified Luteococcus]|uniref:GNAT family N-acetyltransferase n=1 Tax=unclassified Luteococcus TaxID=2639923 RepID=UPI00313F1F2E
MPADDLQARARRWYHDLLLPTFPRDELTTEEDFLAAIRDGRLLAHSAGDADHPDGIVLAEHDAESRVLLLTWLAVRPGCRGGGIGRRLLTEAMASWQAELSPELILGEVEHPESIPASADHGDPASRVRFYHSLGARALDLPHVQPPLRPGGATLENLMLVAFLDRGNPPGATVPVEPVQQFLAGYLPSHQPPYHRIQAALRAAQPAGAVRTIGLAEDAGRLPNRPA